MSEEKKPEVVPKAKTGNERYVALVDRLRPDFVGILDERWQLGSNGGITSRTQRVKVGGNYFVQKDYLGGLAGKTAREIVLLFASCTSKLTRTASFASLNNNSQIGTQLLMKNYGLDLEDWFFLLREAKCPFWQTPHFHLAIWHHVLAAMKELHAAKFIQVDVRSDNICVAAQNLQKSTTSDDAQRITGKFDLKKLTLIDLGEAMHSDSNQRTLFYEELDGVMQKLYVRNTYVSPRYTAQAELVTPGDHSALQCLDWRVDFYAIGCMIEDWHKDVVFSENPPSWLTNAQKSTYQNAIKVLNALPEELRGYDTHPTTRATVAPHEAVLAKIATVIDIVEWQTLEFSLPLSIEAALRDEEEAKRLQKVGYERSTAAPTVLIEAAEQAKIDAAQRVASERIEAERVAAEERTRIEMATAGEKIAAEAAAKAEAKRIAAAAASLKAERIKAGQIDAAKLAAETARAEDGRIKADQKALAEAKRIAAGEKLAAKVAADAAKAKAKAEAEDLRKAAAKGPHIEAVQPTAWPQYKGKLLIAATLVAAIYWYLDVPAPPVVGTRQPGNPSRADKTSVVKPPPVLTPDLKPDPENLAAFQTDRLLTDWQQSPYAGQTWENALAALLKQLQVAQLDKEKRAATVAILQTDYASRSSEIKRSAAWQGKQGGSTDPAYLAWLRYSRRLAAEPGLGVINTVAGLNLAMAQAAGKASQGQPSTPSVALRQRAATQLASELASLPGLAREAYLQPTATDAALLLYQVWRRGAQSGIKLEPKTTLKALRKVADLPEQNLQIATGFAAACLLPAPDHALAIQYYQQALANPAIRASKANLAALPESIKLLEKKDLDCS